MLPIDFVYGDKPISDSHTKVVRIVLSNLSNLDFELRGKSDERVNDGLHRRSYTKTR